MRIQENENAEQIITVDTDSDMGISLEISLEVDGDSSRVSVKCKNTALKFGSFFPYKINDNLSLIEPKGGHQVDVGNGMAALGDSDGNVVNHFEIRKEGTAPKPKKDDDHDKHDDNDPATITAALNVEGYAFDLIYRD